MRIDRRVQLQRWAGVGPAESDAYSIALGPSYKIKLVKDKFVKEEFR